MKDLRINGTEKKHGLKERFLNAYTQLIEFNVVNDYLFAFLSILEAFQLLYFPFRYPVGQTLTYGYLKTFFGFCILVPYLIDNTNNSILLYFWIVMQCLFLLFFCLFFLIIAKFCEARYKPSLVWRLVLRALSFFFVSLKTSSIIPVVYILTLPIVCSNGISCWNGSYIAVSVLSIFGLFLVFFLSEAAELYGDYYINSALPWAQPDSNSKLIFQVFKIIFTFYIAADTTNAYAPYVYPIAILVLCYLAYFQFSGINYYKTRIQILRTLRTGTLLTCLIAVYLSKAFTSNIDLGVGFLIIIGGIGISIAIEMRKEILIHNVLKEDLTVSGNEIMLINAVSKLINLPILLQKNHDILWNLIGILNIHKQKCKNPDCQCKGIEKQMQYRRGSKDMSLEESPLKGSSIQSNELISKFQKERQPEQWHILIGILLDGVILKFPKSVTLRLQIAFYQEFIEKNFHKAYFQLIKTESKEGTFGEELAIHRMKILLDQDISRQETEKVNKEIELDLNVFVKFEEKRRELEESLRTCTQKVIQFWGLLLSQNVKIDKIYNLGGKISSEMKKSHQTFNEIIQIFPDHIMTYTTFSYFLKNVANNEVEAEEYKQKADQIKANLEGLNKKTFSDDLSFSINRENAIIIISGNLESLGVIANVNEHTQDIFGFSYNDLVGFSINRIIPKNIAVLHDSFLIQFFETGKPKILSKEIFTFGQNKNGILVPIAILVKTMPGLTNGLQYISFIRRDLPYISKKYIKFPYKYHANSKLNFIMTDFLGNIIGITERTARTFFIPNDYFEKKKSLFKEQLNIEILNNKLILPEFTEEIKKGTTLKLNFKAFLRMLDRDYLTQDEDIFLENQKDEIEVYIQLMEFEFSFKASYKVFAFVKITQKKQQNQLLKDIKEEDSSQGNEELNVFGDTASSSAASTLTINDKIKTLVKDLKKNIFEQKESKQIIIVRSLIYGTLFLIFALSLVDLVYFCLTLTGIDNLAKLDESANYRRNMFATFLEEFQSYRNLALGLDLNVTQYENNRYGTLKQSLSNIMENIKNNEYSFLDYLKNVNIQKITDIMSAPGVNLDTILINSDIIYTSQSLSIILFEVLATANRVLNEDSITNLDTPFISRMYNKFPMKAKTMTQVEKDVYFIIINGLYNVMNASSQICDIIPDYHNYLLDSEETLYYILHSIRFGIILAIVIFSLPAIRKVQGSKRIILKFFAEVPKKKLGALLKCCELFFNRPSQFTKAKIKRDSSDEVDLNHLMPRGPNMEIVMPTEYKTIETGEAVVTDKEELLNLIKKSPEIESPHLPDNKNSENPDEGEKYLEERFKEERRKKFLSYKAEVGLIFFFFFVCMLIIAASQGGLLSFEITIHTLFDSDFKFETVIQSRWFNLAASIVYLQASTKNYQIIDPSFNKEYFPSYISTALSIEDTMDQIQTNYPSNQAGNVALMATFVQGDYCSLLWSNNLINTTHITLDWCSIVFDGIMENGMKSTVFFLLSYYKSVYGNLTLGYDIQNYTTLLYDKLIFEEVLVPTFDYFIHNTKQTQYDYTTLALVQIIFYYIAFYMMLVITLFILLKYFVGRLNNELWNAKGIVTLLPLDIITQNKSLKEEFSEQIGTMV